MRDALMQTSLLVILAAFLLIGCQQVPNQPVISIENAWGPAAPDSATSGAFYLTIRNRGAADHLLSAHSPACTVAEIHNSQTSQDEVMSMHHMTEGLEVPAKSRLELKPGGAHIMCIGKQASFNEGARFELTIELEVNGAQKVTVEIRRP